MRPFLQQQKYDEIQQQIQRLDGGQDYTEYAIQDQAVLTSGNLTRQSSESSLHGNVSVPELCFRTLQNKQEQYARESQHSSRVSLPSVQREINHNKENMLQNVSSMLMEYQTLNSNFRQHIYKNQLNQFQLVLQNSMNIKHGAHFNRILQIL